MKWSEERENVVVAFKRIFALSAIGKYIYEFVYTKKKKEPIELAGCWGPLFVDPFHYGARA